MKRNILAAILFVAAVAFSCTSKEEASKSLINDGSIVYNPSVSIADFVIDGPATKTTLSIDQTTGAKFTFVDGDELGVYPYAPQQGDQVRFTFTSTGADASAFTFNGSGFGLKANQKYAAYYPADLANAGAECMTEIPVDYTKQRQTSLDGTSFDISAADYLVSNGISPENNACDFTMSHVGALLVMDVTVAEAGNYTELKLTSAGTPFVNTGLLDLTADAIAIETEGVGAATLALGAEGGNGLAIDANQTVRFCMMVAPVDLRSTMVAISLKDSEGVEHTGNFKNGNFKAGKAYLLTASVSASETPAEPTNLSENGTANTYIVDVDNVNAAGYYFDATKAGNGESFTNSYLTNMSCSPQYPTSGNISGAGVKSIWIENNCITDLAYDSDNNTITFNATGVKGCAKVTLTSAADGAGSCVWTWLIWCTDAPGYVEYSSTSPNTNTSLTWKVMDRNIGALTNGPSSNLREQNGFYYQFGNPVPFTKEEFGTFDAGIWRMEDAIGLNPTKVFGNGDRFWFNPWGSSNARNWYGYLWGGWTAAHWGTGYQDMHSSQIAKTKYDPCPVGYQIAPYALFCTGGADASGNHNCLQFSSTSANGLGRYVAGTDDQLYFPCNGARSGEGGYLWDSDEPNYYIFLWTANHLNSNMAYGYLGGRGGSPSLSKDGYHVGRGLGVRCVAEK